jgi:hypothetical protein
VHDLSKLLRATLKGKLMLTGSVSKVVRLRGGEGPPNEATQSQQLARMSAKKK